MLRWGLRLVAWLITLTATAALVVAVLVPRLGGATPYTVLTGSMAPGMPPGTLVVVKPVDASRIGIGTVITYQLKSGEPTVVTHRVVAQSFDADGKPLFRTQGDANPAPDADWVKPVQIRGERWYSVKYLGYASTFLTGHQRQIGIYLVAGALFAYALAMFLSSARDRHRPKHSAPRSAPVVPRPRQHSENGRRQHAHV